MSMKNLLTMITLLLSMNVAFAAGEPMNQDFTDLVKATYVAIELGKQGKGDEFLTSIDAALDIVKDQKLNGDSPKLQRVDAKPKSAKKLGKEGKRAEATAAVEEALTVIKYRRSCMLQHVVVSRSKQFSLGYITLTAVLNLSGIKLKALINTMVPATHFFTLYPQ